VRAPPSGAPVLSGFNIIADNELLHCLKRREAVFFTTGRFRAMIGRRVETLTMKNLSGAL
jgi:hypothetical protein